MLVHVVEKARKLSQQAFREHVYGLGDPPLAIFNEPGHGFALLVNDFESRDAAFSSSLNKNHVKCRSREQEANVEGDVDLDSLC